VVVLRVFSSYSPRLASRLPYVIWEKFSKGGSAEFSGDGSELRDFIHTSDIVFALKLILDNVSNTDFSVWNIASGKPISVKKIVELGAKVFVDCNNDLNVSFKFNNEIRPYDPKILLADVTKLSSIGFTAKVEPELGFDEFFRTIR
jgi:nucleoside-diphosphate-sugar epimerase